jgi:hypothetical protein
MLTTLPILACMYLKDPSGLGCDSKSEGKWVRCHNRTQSKPYARPTGPHEGDRLKASGPLLQLITRHPVTRHHVTVTWPPDLHSSTFHMFPCLLVWLPSPSLPFYCLPLSHFNPCMTSLVLEYCRTL